MKPIKFRKYYWECGDGCCSEYGEEIFIGDERIAFDDYGDYDTFKLIMDKVGIAYEVEDSVKEDSKFYFKQWKDNQKWLESDDDES